MANTLDPQTLAALHSGYLATQKQQQKKKPQPSGNFLTHLLPSIGGFGGGAAGGAAGGALAGTAVLPGIGTAVGGLAGALLGGLGGGAAGKVAENAVEHKSLGSGALGQGIEQGVLSAGPLRLLKGATLGVKAAGSAALDGQGLAGAINAIGDKAATPIISTQLAKTGNALRGEARGIKPGVTQTGTSQRLKPAQSDNINQYLNGLGLKNSAHTQVRAVADDLEKSGKQIGQLVKGSDRPTTVQELSDITASAGAKAKKALGLNPNDQLIQDVNSQLSQAHNLSDLHDLRSTIDDQLKSFYSKGERNTTTTTAVENVLKGYRDGIDKVLSKSIPGFKEANTRYATGLKAQDLLLKSANPQGLKFFGVQTGVGGEGLQATKDLTGRKLGRVAKPLGGRTKPFGVTQSAARTLPIGAAQAGVDSLSQAINNSTNSPNTNPNQDMSNLASNATTTNANIDQLSQGQGDLSSTDSQTPYSKENLLSDIQRDPQNASKYIDYYNSLDKIFTPAGGANLNSTQLQQANNANSGIQSLQTIASELQKNPNAAKLADIPGGSLAGNVTGTGEYKAAVNNATDVIGRLRSGGAINADEEQRFKALLPGAFDDQGTVSYKLQQLYSLFQSFANPQSAQPDSTDLSQALINAGYGQ